MFSFIICGYSGVIQRSHYHLRCSREIIPAHNNIRIIGITWNPTGRRLNIINLYNSCMSSPHVQWSSPLLPEVIYFIRKKSPRCLSLIIVPDLGFDRSASYWAQSYLRMGSSIPRVCWPKLQFSILVTFWHCDFGLNVDIASNLIVSSLFSFIFCYRYQWYESKLCHIFITKLTNLNILMINTVYTSMCKNYNVINIFNQFRYQVKPLVDLFETSNQIIPTFRCITMTS